MSGKSTIQWTEATWNPTTGCTRVSAGCDHCYAFQLHDQRYLSWKRGRWPEAPAQYHQPFSRVQLLPERLNDPLRWRTPRRIFVDSMSDLFHEDVPVEYIARVWAVMALAPHHTFQILTKRPHRIRVALDSPAFADAFREQVETVRWFRPACASISVQNPRYYPLPHVWLGTSVEDQDAADDRIPDLLTTPDGVRFLSCEPLLGQVDLTRWVSARVTDVGAHIRDGKVVPGLDWVIIGGESGPHARPMHLGWVRDLLAQCRAKGIAAFVKQLGSVWAEERKGRQTHGGDPAQWPEDLRVREYPKYPEYPVTTPTEQEVAVV